MIHFKKLKRLLLVAGLLSTPAIVNAAECKFQLDPVASGNYKVKLGDSATCSDGYYLLDPNEYTILTTGKGILVSVKTNGGTQTITVESNPKPGFYKNKNGSVETYIQCKNYGFCEIVTPTGDCTDANTGKLIKDSKKSNVVALCLGNFAPPPITETTQSKFATLPFATTTDSEKYLVKHKSGDNVFSFDKKANFYAVTHDTNSIVFDESLTHADNAGDQAALVTDGKLIPRQNELCNIGDSSGRYYTCTAGICKSSEKTAKAGVFESTDEPVKLKITVTGDRCTASTTGGDKEVYESSGYLLLSQTSIVKYTKTNENSYTCNVVKEPGYYANTFHRSVIKCTLSSSNLSCTEITSSDSACDSNNTEGIEITKYNAIICIDSSTGTVQRFSGEEDHALGGTSSALGTEATYYKVKVTKDSIVLDKTGGKTYFIQDKLTPTMIYECDPDKDAKCTVLVDTYHYDENDEILYHCVDSTTGCVNMGENPNVIKPGFYLSELKDGNNYNSLIKCTENIDENEVKTISCENYKDLSAGDTSLTNTVYATKGYYLDADQKPASAERKRISTPVVPSIIECTKDTAANPPKITCIKQTTLTKNQAYLNEGSKRKDVIVCTDVICEVMNNPTNENAEYYYLDATYADPTTGDGKTQIITCIKTGCTTSGVITPDSGVAYIDSGIKDEDGNLKKLIKLDSDKKWTSSDGSATLGVAYLDGGDETKKSVIICTEDDGCVSEPGKSDVPGYVYINGINSATNQIVEKRDGTLAAEKFNSIIRCDEGSQCKSVLVSVMDGEAYIDATAPITEDIGGPENIIKCTTDAGCVSVEGIDSNEGKEADTYVNALKNEQIINCIEDNDKKGCIIFTSNVREGRSEYYPTYKGGAESLINCYYLSTGKICEKISTAVTTMERRDIEDPAGASNDDTKDYAFNVFINALNGKSGTVDKNPLIICGDDGKCQSSNSIPFEDNGEKVYYRNYDYYNTEKNADDLIVCTKDTKDVITCSIIDGSNGKVYLNGNYSNSKNQIIKCSSDSEKGCEEVQTNTGENAGNEYYVNYGNVPKDNDKLTGSLIKCTNKDNKCERADVDEGYIYINNADTSSTIQCTKAKGCTVEQSWANDVRSEVYLNYDDILPTNDVILISDLIKCTKGTEKVVCKSDDGIVDEVYIDSFDNSKLIKCIKDEGCKSVDSEADKDKPAYYYNAAAPKDKLSNNIIKCIKEKEDAKAACSLINAKNGDVYLNSNIAKDSNKNNLIFCSEGTEGDANNPSKCKLEEPIMTDNPSYYVNSGNPSTSSKLKNGLIKCSSSGEGENIEVKCEQVDVKENQIYLNGGPNKAEKQIIKCTSSECTNVESKASDGNNEYYINAGDEEKDSKNDIIVCSYDATGQSVSCVIEPSSSAGVFINSNYNASGDKNQLIQCTSDGGCIGKQCTSTRNTEYYVNAESTDLDNAIISCASNKCEKITPESPSYFVGTDSDVNGLIECITTAADSTNPSTAGCTYKSPFTSQGYYLNAGYNRATNQTIICDVSEGCQTTKVELGIYVNAGESQAKPIIKCEKEGSECTAYASPNCPSSSATDVVPGSYCYSDSQLKFYNTSNSTSIAASKADDYYVYATVSSDVFPGIRGSDVSSLFKVSHYYINRFFQSGVIIIDRNNKLVDNLVSGQSDIVLYDCNDSTKVCTQRPGCTPNTYMFDSENRKAIFCNAGTLENAQFTGYVVDSTRAVGTNHPYIIKCDDNGKKCSSFKPKVTSYYENSGYDASTNSLILCSNNNCATAAAEIGYYVGREGTGIIQCTSATSCAYTPSKHKVKYVNAGANKSTYAIIDCIKGSCSAAKAKVGYYMTYSNSILIQCTSSSICAEFTPTVNYYDNADSSESSNSIINCVQNSQVISCALEATNNGFYMSSQPNVLIRCKSGSKCKTVTVKNGIFRGAIKGLVGGSKRSDAEVEAEAVKAREQESELEEDGQSVTMPRDSDEAYGIIRCVAGKCQALSVSEVAAIPMCEFANNKCYITLEYAMTKSATTSISAGNICTNTDRSVFYFATDTIVVKPNVISGVTATYVYTTTNSNCLEVNDSYDDMYFTVGSNIYLLDQGSVLQFYESGYYFINTAKNTLVNGNDIDAYNDESVKLYKCNGSSCRIQDKPDSMTYYADVNKRILKYNVNSDSYSFAYNKDITCIFANNKCTPNADLKNQEFCITYKGELVLARADIKNRETGECYKASSINSNIYGYSQYLYQMNIYSAQMVDETGYYIVSLSTNSTVVSKNYKTKNNGIVVYGCQHSSCKIYEPEESTYYYDAQAKTLLRYRNGVWSTPSTSGYAYISLEPASAYIYRFTKTLDEIKINNMVNYGYYYTVDQEMYNCNEDENGDCTEIDNSGYYFTNAGEIYQCVHDSENLEPTECTKQACISGQYYYIDEAYYRCELSSVLVPVLSRYCSYNENVVVNFPLALSEELPDKIKQAVEGIEKNNNSTAIIKSSRKNYLESVSGIFTNCTYNVEETKSTFDMVCVNNYVTVDEENDEVKICSIEQLGYVECVEDENNPEKCNVSGALSFLRPSLSILFMVAISLIIYALF